MHDAAESWVAIEGPCLAGKTGLVEALLSRLRPLNTAMIPDYADFVGGGTGMPDPDPATWAEEAAGLEDLLVIEQARIQAHLPNPRPLLTIIDRSVLTLLAHCAGTDRRHRRPESFAERAAQLIAADSRVEWPDAIVYLDVANVAQHERNRITKFAPDSVFLDAGYNAGFRDHFARARIEQNLPMIWIDAGTGPAAVLDNALGFIRHLVEIPGSFPPPIDE